MCALIRALSPEATLIESVGRQTNNNTVGITSDIFLMVERSREASSSPSEVRKERVKAEGKGLKLKESLVGQKTSYRPSSYSVSMQC